MNKPLQKKLRLQPDQRLAFINQPPGMLSFIGELPAGVSIEKAPAIDLDFVLLFVHNSAEMAQYAPIALSSIKSEGLLWIAYPKRSSGMESDLNRDTGWQIVTAAGYRGVFQIAVDETWSAVRFRPYKDSDPQDQIDAQYSGKKAALRPIYDRILEVINALGDDISLQPRKSYVAFARRKQFALVKTSTITRVDLGLKFKEPPISLRLEEAPGLGSGSITHKLALASLEEVDQEVVSWLKMAYEGL